MAEGGCAGDAIAEVAAIVGAIGEVEGLGDELKVDVLAEFEVLGQAHVELEERIAAERIIFRDGAALGDAVDAVEAVLRAGVVASEGELVFRIASRHDDRIM